MRLTIAVMLLFAFTAFITTGCPRKPGTPTNGKTPTEPAAKDDFSITPGQETVELEPGKDATVKISVARGEDFKEDAKIEVTLKAEGKGLSVDPESKTLTKDDTELTVKIAAAEEAESGEVHVSATGAGKTQEATIMVEVKGKEKKNAGD